MEKSELLKIALRHPPHHRLYIGCGVLLSLGVDPSVLDGIPDGRPVPVLASDVVELCKEE
jgi:hypothetical protein